MDILYFFLPAIVALGILTSYEDIKYGKIRNKYIISAIIYSLVINAILISYIYTKDNLVNINYIVELVITTLFALGAGFFLWYKCFWTSGDAKLYVAYSALVPLSVYSFGYIKYVPSIIILINTFIPLTLFYFLKILFKTSYKEKKIAFKNIFKIKPFFTYLTFIFSILWLPKIIISFFNIKIPFIGIMAIILLFSCSIKILFKKNTLYILSIICVARFMLDKSVYSLQFLKEFGLLLLILIIFKSFFIELGKNIFSEKMGIKGLKKGMILLDKIYKKNEKYEKEEEKNIFEKRMEIKNPFTPKRYYFVQKGEGLTNQDIKKIKKLEAGKKLNFSNININKITPFAPYMFGGVLITLFFRGNMMVGLFNFNHFITEYFIELRILTIWIITIILITIIAYRNFKKQKS